MRYGPEEFAPAESELTGENDTQVDGLMVDAQEAMQRWFSSSMDSND